MPDVVFNGAAGRLEGRYFPSKRLAAPVALILHHHPLRGGSMTSRVALALAQSFQRHDFAVLRFNSRGVGRSQGRFDRGEGELADAASALDWLQTANPAAEACWIAGHSFGAWVGLHLLMRRPEIERFIALSLPANSLDFGFLAPCPASGLIVQGGQDSLVPRESVLKLVKKLSQQRDVRIRHEIVDEADHLFTGGLDELVRLTDAYIETERRAVVAARAEAALRETAGD